MLKHSVGLVAPHGCWDGSVQAQNSSRVQVSRVQHIMANNSISNARFNESNNLHLFYRSLKESVKIRACSLYILATLLSFVLLKLGGLLLDTFRGAAVLLFLLFFRLHFS